MNFDLSEEQQLVRQTARKFAQEVLAPQAADFDRSGEIPMSIYRQIAELGLMGVTLPDSLGGAEAGAVAYSLVIRELAGASSAATVAVAVTNMVGEVINAYGTESQRGKYIPLLTAGRSLGAFALSEVGAGSDPGGMLTTAERDGDAWVINGSKQWISHGNISDVMIVWARTGEAGPRGLSCFVVDKDAVGVSTAKLEDKMGLRGSHTAALLFENVRVPSDALLGSEGAGFRIAMTALDGGRIGISSQALGVGEAALELAVDYAKEREQFGKPIAKFQAIQWMIADSRAELDAANVLILRAAQLKERGEPFSLEASMAKVYATEKAWDVCNRAVQIHGGYGYTREFAVERLLRDVRVAQIYEGTSEVQRIVISRAITRS